MLLVENGWCVCFAVYWQLVQCKCIAGHFASQWGQQRGVRGKSRRPAGGKSDNSHSTRHTPGRVHLDKTRIQDHTTWDWKLLALTTKIQHAGQQIWNHKKAIKWKARLNQEVWRDPFWSFSGRLLWFGFASPRFQIGLWPKDFRLSSLLVVNWELLQLVLNLN